MMTGILESVSLRFSDIPSVFPAPLSILLYFCIFLTIGIALKLIVGLLSELDFNMTSVVYINQKPVAQVDYQKIIFPFSITLATDSKKTGEVIAKVTNTTECVVKIFQRVSLKNFHEIMQRPWRSFDDIIEKEDDVEAVSSKSVKLPSSDSFNEVIIPKLDDLPPLGPPPRSVYPAVMVVRRLIGSDDPSDVGALIAIIHLKDEHCPMDSSIIFQYLKLYSGQLVDLKALYTLTPENKMQNQPQTEVRDEEYCVVCKTSKPSRAFLPCRHVCSCRNCFDQLRECPICRARILSFFVTDAEEESFQKTQEEEVLPEPAEPSGLLSRLTRTARNVI